MTDSAPPSTEPAAAKPEKKKKPRRTWRQRFKILLLIALIGLCLFRIALNVLLPTVIDRVAGLFGLEVGYQRLSLSLLGGTAHIWGLEVRPAEGGPSIATVDYVQGNLAPLELLRARLVVYRAEVDGVDLTVERSADGTIPLLQKFASAQSKAAPAAQTGPAPAGKPMSLEAPLRVDAIRLSHVTATLRDESVTPAFEATVRTNVRVSDVGLTDGPAKFELDVGIDPVLDTLRVTGEARTSANSLKANVQVLLRGLHPKAAAGYLTPLGLNPIADSMTVQANATLNAETRPDSSDIKATLALDHVSAVTDGQEWASLASLTLDAKSINPSAIELGKLEIADGFASGKRSADGKIQVAGLELAPPAKTPTTAPSTPATPVVVSSSGGTPLRLALDALELRRLQANIADEGVTPTNAIAARLETLSIKNIDTASTAAVPISLTAGISGLVQQATVNGQATLFAPTKQLTLAVRGSGIKPDALAPYLRPLGLSSTLSAATASADLKAAIAFDDNAITADASASSVTFADGGTSLIELSNAGISGLTYRPKDGSVSVKSIDLAGPAVSVAREADGSVATIGFRFAPPPASTAPTTAAVAASPTTTPAIETSTQPAPLALPRVEVSRFNWAGLKLTLEDRAATPTQTFVIQDAGVELRDLLIDLAATDKQTPGTFRAHLKSPGLADEFVAEGSFTPDPGRFTVDVAVNGQGLSGAPLAGYLRPFGVEPILKQGTLRARATAALAQTNGQLSADLELSNTTYADGDTELVGIDTLRVGGLSPKGKRIDLTEVTVIKPRAKVARDADGALVAGGVRLIAAKPTTRPAGNDAAPPTTLPSVTKPSAMLAELPIQLGVAKLNVENASLDVSDAAAPNGPASLRLSGGVKIDNLDVSPAARPATLHATAAVNGALRQATVDGTITASPVAPAVDLTVTANGLAAGPLNSYLPPTIHPTLADGTFATKLSASAANHSAGGLTAKVNVRDLKLTDAASVLAKVDDFTLAATRLDPVAEIFSLAEISSRGVAADVKQTPSGVIEAAGIRLVAAPPPSPAATQAAADQAAAAPTTAPSAPVASVAQMVTDARRPLPWVSIEKLDLGVERLGLAGFTGPDAAPIELKDFRAVAPKPISVGGKRADADAPLDLKLTGGLSPIVGGFDVTVSAKPMANEPSLAVDVAATGIRGEGLLAVLPALKDKIDGAQLTDGQFNTHLDATVNYGRRGPRDLDLGRGFTAEFNLKPLEFRATPGGPVIAGVTAVRGEGIKVEPAKANVLIKSIDVTTPIFHAHRDNDGSHAVGLVVKLAPQEPVESLAPASQPVTQPIAEAIAATPPAKPGPAPRPANEIRIDHLTVSGIDCRIEDRTTTPGTIVPLKSLDVDVRDLSNQLPWSGKSVKFSVLMTSDKVPLPPRKGISGTATTQQAEKSYTEDRELFSQITASGKIGFARSGDTVALDGWTKTAVNGFELLGVRGLAQIFGVTVGGGAFDDTNDVRFRPDGDIETRSKIVFTNLSLSEAANGPLQQLFKLPAPIDVAIGAVTDPDGSITLNLPVPIKNGAVSAGDVVGPALGAVTNVLVTGIASAPLKAVSGVGGLLGLGGKEAAPEAPVFIGFLRAYDGLDRDGDAAITYLVQQLKDDDALELQLRHSLSDDDVSRTGERVNPSPEQALALAAQVRQQKVELLQKHDTLAAQARGDLGANASAPAKATLDTLRVVSQQIAKADTALDDLYALTGPSAAQQTERRTRAASLELARRRLDTIKAALTAASVKNIDGRVHATNPQFDPAPETGGGFVTVTLVRKKS